MIDLTRMFSDKPGHARPQAADAAHHQLDRHAGLRGLVERVDDIGIDQRVHLHPDRGRPAVTGMAGLAVDMFDHALAQGQRRHRHLLDVARFGIAGDVVEHPRGVAADDRVRREVGQVGVDARGHRMIVAGAGVDVGGEAAALAAHDQRQLGVGLQFDEIRTPPARRRVRDRAPSGCWLPRRTAP